MLWPLLLLLQHDLGFSGRSAIQFWQVYFITTPHRWITILLVLFDRRRSREQSALYIGLAAIVVAVCVGTRILTGALTCLLTVDYIWNAWHFAAQHHGVYRIYTRMSPGLAASASAVYTQKWLMRSFLLYVTLRIASSTFAGGDGEQWIKILDRSVLLIPAFLVITEFRTPFRGSLGRRLYFFSVMGIYSALLWSVSTNRPGLTLSLATASAWFHASEYLAVVGWHVQRQGAVAGSESPILNWLAPRWAVAISTFAVILGSGSWLFEHRFIEPWLLINVIVAFLHYGYDGFIWKAKRMAGASESVTQKLPA